MKTKRRQKTPRVLIEVEGGRIQSITTDDPRVIVYVADYDDWHEELAATPPCCTYEKPRLIAEFPGEVVSVRELNQAMSDDDGREA